MHALQIARTYFRLGLMNFMQYRADFFIAIVNAFIEFGSQFLGIYVIFNQTDSLRGWSREDLIVLIGVQAIVAGILGVVIQPSLNAFMDSVRQGTFDFVLTKPADAQLMASLQSVAPQSLTQLTAGVIVAIAGMVLGAGFPGIGGLIAFLVMLVAGTVMVWSFMMVLASLTFWFTKLDNIMMIFNTMFGNAGSWPITIFPAWLRVTLTFIIPVAFAVTIPAQALIGTLSLQVSVLTLTLAMLFAIGSRMFWNHAVTHYTGASA